MQETALAGLRVLDLSETVGGQYCGRLLADFGAAVTLVEPPAGSCTRTLHPFSVADGSSLVFRHLNTGKTSVRVASHGDPALAALLRDCDVALLPPGFPPERVASSSPRCVTATVSAFGEDGPLAGWKGPEIVLQALSGMMTNNGAYGREPLYGCGRRASFAAGVAAYVGIAAALFARGTLGRGQHVEIAEAETAAAMCFPFLMQHIYSGTRRTRLDFNNPCGQVLCRDGWVCIWIYNHRWTAVCRALGLERLLDDPRFAQPGPRRDNWAALFAIIQEAVADLEAEHLVDRLQSMEIIAAKSFRPTELADHPHLAARDYWETTPGTGRPLLGPPFRLSRTPRRVIADAPAPGPFLPPVDVIVQAARPTPSVAAAAAGPLAGLRVIELTTAWAGPMSGRVLGYLGAESIHVESPNRVNSWRQNKDAPNPINFADGVPGERFFDRSFLFNSQNINKLSCILNLKTPEARDVLRRLVAVSDVLICNFRPGTLAKLGLDYESLRAIRPDIIVAELPAYGTTGPMSRYAALGPTMEMAAGMSSLVGYAGEQPETTGPSYLDPIGGFNAAAAVLTALLHRQRTGEGQYVEVPQVEAAMQFIGPELLQALETGRDPERKGNRRPDAAPHDAFRTAGEDEWVAIACFDDAEWRGLAQVIGEPDLAGDPRFATALARQENQDEIGRILSAWTAGRDKHEAAALLQGAGVPAAPVENPWDLVASDYLRHRGFFTELEHPDAGRHPYPGLPVRLSITPGRQHRAAPTFGGDNGTVLGGILGLDPAEVERLGRIGATATVPLPGG
jgi:crotonobetainyl-CoA:carnitine CoA-transferase CaiB-like acyl-CoA transferase